jgi:hypothetical protein
MSSTSAASPRRRGKIKRSRFEQHLLSFGYGGAINPRRLPARFCEALPNGGFAP